MDAAAKKWIQQYKKLFDQVAARNAGMNVVEDVTTVDKKEEIKKIGKLVDELGGTATQVPKKVIKKIGKLVPNDEKNTLTSMNQENMNVSERDAINEPKVVVSIESNPELDARISNSTKNKYDVIREYLIEVYGGHTFELSDGRRAIMDKSDAKELSHKADKKRTAQLGNLDKIISKAKYDHSAYNVEHNKFIDFHYYEITVKYGGEEFDLWINVGTGKYDGINHIYSITNKKEDASTNYGVGGPVGNHLQNASPIKSISQKSQNSNTSDKNSSKDFDLGERSALADGKRATAGEVAAVKSSISKRGIDPKGIIAIADKYFARYSGQLTRTGVRYEFLAAADLLFDPMAGSADKAYAKVEALAEELVTNEKDTSGMTEDIKEMKRHIREITFEVREWA